MTIQPIIDKLSELLNVHRALLEIGEAKKQAMIDNNIEELTVVLRQESKSMKAVAQLEEERMELLRQYMQSLGIRIFRRMTVSDLVKVVTDIKQKQQLLDAQNELLQTLEKLKRLNALNMELAGQALKFIQYSYDLVVDDPINDVLYQHPGQQQYGASARRMFDTKA